MYAFCEILSDIVRNKRFRIPARVVCSVVYREKGWSRGEVRGVKSEGRGEKRCLEERFLITYTFHIKESTSSTRKLKTNYILHKERKNETVRFSLDLIKHI